MSKTLKITPRTIQTTRQPLRGKNRNNQAATNARTTQTETHKKSSRSANNKITGDADRPKRSLDDKPKRSLGDKPPRQNSDKPRDFSERPQRSFDDKPKRGFGDKPRHPQGDKPRGISERARRSFDDKPERDLADRPERSQADDANPWGRSLKPRAKSSRENGGATKHSKNFQEPRRHGKMRDDQGRLMREVPPRLAPADAGIRLSKHLSDQGLCSRREADEFIEKGWVTVNGTRATLGQRIKPTDRVQVARQAQRAQESRVTILINKPVGLVSGQAEDGYEPAASLITPENHWTGDNSGLLFEPKHLRGLAPAGRLDIDSVGLLVLTQDGRVAKALIGDKSDVDKEYLVRVEGSLSDEGLRLLNHGLLLDGIPLRPAKVSWQNQDQLRFVLTEGKKRQIRRMCELVGLHVVGLKRIRIGQVVLGDLPTGQWRYLREDEAF